MIKKGSFLFFLTVCFFGQAQMNNLLHLNAHSKDNWFFNNKKHQIGDISEVIEGDAIIPEPLKSFLPVQPFHTSTKTLKIVHYKQKQGNYDSVTLDKSFEPKTLPMKYFFTSNYKRPQINYLFFTRGKNHTLGITPALNFSMGKDFRDTTNNTLFRNTRGFMVEGTLLDNVSFSTSFYENQARFSSYENDYISSHGEFYPTSNGNYIMQNAVVPGGARTKPFKTNGYDFAFAQGYISYRPNKYLTLTTGNNPQFVGLGYRSLLLSDNSYGAPYIRADVSINSKWAFNYYRARYMNLVRQTDYSTVEAYYTPKAFTSSYISYKPFPEFELSLFEGSIWLKDQTKNGRTHALSYTPIPFLANLASDTMVYSINGLNMNYQVSLKKMTMILYGQMAVGNLYFNQHAFQLGIRQFYGEIKKFSIKTQLEYNFVSKEMYQSKNRSLSYSHYNLPIAHVNINAFNEFILRTNFECKSIYFDYKGIVYLLKDKQDGALLQIDLNNPSYNGSVHHNWFELGYLINRQSQMKVFSRFGIRTQNGDINRENMIFSFGLKTGFINQYNDY